MAKTYNTLGTVAPGDVLRANSGTAAYNGVITNVNNYRVPPMCSVTLTTTADYTQDTNIVFTSENYDTDGMFAPSSADVTIKTAGIYLVTFTGRATSTSSANFQPVIRLAGANDPGEEVQQLFGAAVTDARFSVSAVRSLAVNDVINARIQWSGTITLQGGTTQSPTLTATWLGQSS